MEQETQEQPNHQVDPQKVINSLMRQLAELNHKTALMEAYIEELQEKMEKE
jgi:hypothetical protein